jgi:hypothetical protein
MRMLGLAMLTICLAGCYEKSAQGDQSTYAFAGWIGVAVILGGLVFVPAGWFLRRLSMKYGLVLMFMGPVLLLIIAPAMYSDKVVVDNDHFEARYGFWFAPSQHNIRFSDLQEIRFVEVPGARNRSSLRPQDRRNRRRRRRGPRDQRGPGNS